MISGVSEKRAQKALNSDGVYIVTGGDALIAKSDLKPGYQSRVNTGEADKLSSGKPPWKPCGVNDKKTKQLKKYGRQKIKGHAGKTARLRCGNKKWGLRHIEKNHYPEWDKYASMMVEPWQIITNWAWTQTLSHPDAKKYQGGKRTFLYRTPVEVKNSDGKVMDKFYSYVAVMKGYQNIVTAFTGKK